MNRQEKEALYQRWRDASARAARFKGNWRTARLRQIEVEAAWQELTAAREASTLPDDATHEAWLNEEE